MKQDTFSNIVDLINKWPTRAAFAVDINCNANSVRGMVRRNSINPKHWDNVILACERKGISGVTRDVLYELWLKGKRSHRA